MTLERWQSRLAESLNGRPEPSSDPWWQQTASSHGLAVTRRIRVSWAFHRLREAGGLSLRALESACQEVLLARWLDQGLGNAPSLEQEVELLREDILAATRDPSHARSICLLEITLSRGLRDRERGLHGQRISAAPTRIAFHGPPLDILVAVTEGVSPPLDTTITWVEIWPDTPDRWSIIRSASGEETARDP
jgi:hypothetical protein